MFEKYICDISNYGKEFLELIKFSGPEASIKIDTSPMNKTKVNKKSHTKFTFSCNNFTSQIFFNKNKNVKRSVRCVLIDGFTSLHM